MPDETVTAFPPVVGTAKVERKPESRRRRLFLLLGAAVLAAAAIFATWWLLVASHHQSTDDAYVQADVAQVTPLVSGAIISAPSGDTRHVLDAPGHPYTAVLRASVPGPGWTPSRRRA